mgnify:CR=1 FL=1
MSESALRRLDTSAKPLGPRGHQLLKLLPPADEGAAVAPGSYPRGEALEAADGVLQAGDGGLVDPP